MPSTYPIALLATLFLWIGRPKAQTAGPVINEVAGSNATFSDEDGDTPDWIELHNPSDSALDLGGYFLSDDPGELGKWALPARSLAPQAHLLVFASGKDRVGGARPHTNFKISASGEAVSLSTQAGELVDRVEGVALDAGQSYARMPDGSSAWRFTATPTPGAANRVSTELTFSHEEGFYAHPISLEIASGGDSVYYTTDGSVPTPRSNAYTGPIAIADRSGEPNVLADIPTTTGQDELDYHAWEAPAVPVRKATVLRLRAYRSGAPTGSVLTKAYFIGDPPSSSHQLPVVSIVGDPNAFFHPDTGIYVTGVNFDPGIPGWTGNSFQRGREWERDVHVAYFEPGGAVGFSQSAGLRVHGNKSRQAAQKSLRLYARGEYGDGDFDYPLLENREVSRYERFLLRTTMGAWWAPTIVADDIAQEVVRDFDLETQESSPVIVYLNGEYWGVHTIRDRIDERYIGYLYGLDPDEVEFDEWKDPDIGALKDYAETHDLSRELHYAYVAGRIDVSSFIDYYVAEQFFANIDWPVNNWRAWRERDGGRWRWIFYDVDAGFESIDKNMFEHVTDEAAAPAASAALFKGLIANEDFRERYIARWREALATTFRPERTLAKLDSLRDVYAPAIPEHITRWGFPDTEQAWDSAVHNRLAKFFDQRPCVVEEQLEAFFGLEASGAPCGGERLDKLELTVAPNPNQGDFAIRNDSERLIRFNSVSLSTALGRRVADYEAVTLRAGESLTIQAKNVVAGIYLLTVDHLGELTTRRVYISR